MAKLEINFYRQDNVLTVARSLLGKYLCTCVGGVYTSGIIVETEAYNGRYDRASHAYNDRRTRRTETMYRKGGVAYVYLCYGIHYLFNVVIGPEDNPLAVLIRAIEPADGLDTMLQRRNMAVAGPRLSAGPGVLTQALGIDRELDGQSLLDDVVWIEDRGFQVPAIVSSSRIGVGYAGEDALLPYRFLIPGNPYVSRKP